ncbi:hypothetical protein D9M73_110430 [compost metagenome]
MRVGCHRRLCAVRRELQHERQRRIVEREGRGACDRAGHVGDTIMNDAVHLEHRVLMRCRVAGLEAAALIDRDIDQHRAALHRLDHLARHQFGGSGARHQHRADHQMRILDRGRDRRLAGISSLDLAAEEHVELGQPRVRNVVDGDVGAHADRHLRGIDARHAAAQNRDLGRGHTRHAA